MKLQLHKNDVQSFAQSSLNTFNLVDLGIDKEVALKELKNELLTEFNDLNSDATKKARSEYFKIEGTSIEDYSEKLLVLNQERRVIYGIRHMGGNREIPFIQLLPNFSISSKKEGLDIYRKIKSEFEIFNPLYLSFWSKNEIDVDFIGSTYMVSACEEFKKIRPWNNESKFDFEDISDDSYYEWYKSGYKEFHEEFPELEKKVTLNSVASMGDSLEQGLLKFVTIENEKIGLIAAEKSELLGHDGIYFHEIYIEKKWKGKGLAKAIQRKFVENFSEGHEFIWGTIDSSNLPSYKTAYSNGRRPIRFESFIKL